MGTDKEEREEATCFIVSAAIDQGSFLQRGSLVVGLPSPQTLLLVVHQGPGHVYGYVKDFDSALLCLMCHY